MLSLLNVDIYSISNVAEDHI